MWNQPFMRPEGIRVWNLLGAYSLFLFPIYTVPYSCRSNDSSEFQQQQKNSNNN